MRRLRLDPTGDRGFTLVELMVVIVILGLMVGVVSISWQSVLPRSTLNANVRQLASRLQGARSEAIAKNGWFLFHYDLDNEAYWIQSPYEAETQRVKRFAELQADFEDGDYIRNYETELAQGITFEEVHIFGETYTDGIVSVWFNPVGQSTYHTVVLHQETTDGWHTIEVLGLTGLFRFHDGVFRRDEPDGTDFD